MNIPLIALSGIRKSYGGKDGAPAVEVLHGIDLSIGAGEFIAIVGASGSGKSTLMHILGCLDQASSGSYRFAGKDIAAFSADQLAQLRREAFGFVFQGYHLIPTLDAAENVQVPAVYAGTPATAREARAQALLDRLGLAERSGNLPRQLSGGQQQRVSIARALMNGGQVILADEPTGALDSQTGVEVMKLLAELADAGHTVILITHDPAVAAQARRVVRIHDGRVVQDSAALLPSPLAREGLGMRGVPEGHDGAGGLGRDAALRQPPSPDRRLPQPSSARGEGVAAASRPATVVAPHADSTAGFAALLEAFRGAWRTLWVSRFRTFLTLLSFVIGVTSVIVLVAVGQGTGEKTLQQIALYGTQRMYVLPDVERGTGLRGSLREADVQVVASVPNVRHAMPYLAEAAMLRAGGEAFNTSVWAVSTDAPEVLNWGVAHGTFFNEADEQTLAAVIVLGKVARERLFPQAAPREAIGQYVLVNQMPFRVIGELAEKGTISGDRGDDDLVLMPYSTGSLRVFGKTELNAISVLMESLDNMEQTVRDIQHTLARARGAEDFRISNSAARVLAQKEVLRQQTLLLALIAGISLLVGGLGVMNIMLMSVKERTKEIGIRMATGARQSDIRRQFLSEAVVVSLVGGSIGLLLGLAIGAVLILFDVPVIFSIRAMLGAFGCAVATGLVFGFMPARQAARLNPVVALAGE